LLRVDAYTSFRSRILSGELKPGQFVTQRELSELAGVPVGPAREAIQRLEFETLLKVYPQRGIQITDISAKLIRESYELRLVLEMGAIRHFATEGSMDLIDALIEQTAAARSRASYDQGEAFRAEAVEVDWTMHDAVIESLNNQCFADAYRINAARIRLIRANNVFSPSRMLEVLDEHLAILEAARARKATQAGKALQAHIGKSKDFALRGM
jgi:DNA-binding GntR family transcriptional regulator